MPFVMKRPEDISQLAGCKVVSAGMPPGGGLVMVVETMLGERYRLTMTGGAVPALNGTVLVLNPSFNLNVQEEKEKE